MYNGLYPLRMTAHLLCRLKWNHQLMTKTYTVEILNLLLPGHLILLVVSWASGSLILKFMFFKFWLFLKRQISSKV